MRALALLWGIAFGLAMALRYPFVGVLLWSWFTLQQPHREAFGFVQSAPINLVIAIVTIGAWLISRERKSPPTGIIFWLLVLFLAWMTFNSFFAYDPTLSWTYWDRTWKTLLLGLVVAVMATDRVRMHALIWIVVISLFYYGVKGGIFTIVTGGHFHVVGPHGTMLGDNNALAAILLMALPLANYLRLQSANKLVARLLLAGIVLTVVSILGSYSRGALIGLAALGLFMLWRTRKRVQYLSLGLMVLVFVFAFMPGHFFHRMDTISHAQQDPSFEGRVTSWKVAYMYARDHFPFGAGFYGPQVASLYHQYFPDHVALAAHSIFFQVLGEHGFIGLAIYLCIIIAGFVRCSKIVRATGNKPEHRWAHDLAISVQASIFVFCVAGAALSIAYYDLFIMEIGLLLPLREITLLEGRQRPSKWGAAGLVGADGRRSPATSDQRA